MHRSAGRAKYGGHTALDRLAWVVFDFGLRLRWTAGKILAV